MIRERMRELGAQFRHHWHNGLGASVQVWLLVVMVFALGAIVWVGGPMGSKVASAQSNRPRGAALTIRVGKGAPLHVVTDARTVGGALAELGIPLGADVLVSPALGQSVASGETVTISRASAQAVSLSTALAYPVVQVPDSTLALGMSAMIQTGSDGYANLQSRPGLFAGAVGAARVVGRSEIRQATPQVVLVGTTPLRRDTYSGQYLTRMTVKATAYWRNPRWSNGRTATGAYVHFGSIAVDPSVIPLGSRLFVQGYGLGVADDTGSAVKGLHVDLYFPTLAEAQAWGMRYVTVYVLSRG